MDTVNITSNSFDFSKLDLLSFSDDNKKNQSKEKVDFPSTNQQITRLAQKIEDQTFYDETAAKIIAEKIVKGSFESWA